MIAMSACHYMLACVSCACCVGHAFNCLMRCHVGCCLDLCAAGGWLAFVGLGDFLGGTCIGLKESQALHWVDLALIVTNHHLLR